MTSSCDSSLPRKLSGHFKGDIIGPDHADYEHARLVWNAMIDRRPGLILRCTSTQDVVAAVNAARAHGLPPSVRCGGHNVAGKAMSDGGLTIDLSGLREVTVDAERKLVHAGGGDNFGIVTGFTFRAYDFGPMMRIGVSVYEPEHAAVALRGYATVVRLGRLKAQYDPQNLFRMNYNISPAQ